MKILMLTPYLPYPPASGGQIRTLNLLKYLHERHSITLVSLYKNEKEKKYSKQLIPYCDRIYACRRAEKPWQLSILASAIFTPKPLLIARNFSQEAKLLLENLLKKERFDVIHAETFYIMPHIPTTKIPVLLVEQTVEHEVYQHFVNRLPLPLRLPLYYDIQKLKFWERHYWKKATLVASVSEADQHTIQQTAPEIKPVIIPNGAGDEMIVKVLKPKIKKPLTLLFQGNFFWLQNKEAARYLIDILAPLFFKKFPEAIIKIAGQETQRVRLTSAPNVSYTEIHPEDSVAVRKLYEESTVFIAPIFGPGGTRLKLLAAMASGLPIIASKTAVQGLDVAHNTHVLIAENPEDFTEQLKRLLNEKNLYEKIRTEAHALILKTYSWKSISQKLETYYQKTINLYAHRH